MKHFQIRENSNYWIYYNLSKPMFAATSERKLQKPQPLQGTVGIPRDSQAGMKRSRLTSEYIEASVQRHNHHKIKIFCCRSFKHLKVFLDQKMHSVFWTFLSNETSEKQYDAIVVLRETKIFEMDTSTERVLNMSSVELRNLRWDPSIDIQADFAQRKFKCFAWKKKRLLTRSK